MPRSGIESASHVHTPTTIPGRAKRERLAIGAASYPLPTGWPWWRRRCSRWQSIPWPTVAHEHRSRITHPREHVDSLTTKRVPRSGIESASLVHTRTTIPDRAKGATRHRCSVRRTHTAGHGGDVVADGWSIPWPAVAHERRSRWLVHTMASRGTRASIPNHPPPERRSLTAKRVPRSGIESASLVHTPTTIPGRAKRGRPATGAASYPLPTAGHGGGVVAPDGSPSHGRPWHTSIDPESPTPGTSIVNRQACATVRN